MKSIARTGLWLLVLPLAGLGAPGCASSESIGDDASGHELCLNSVDDDADERVDCADLYCKDAYICVQAIPAGWEELGYVALAQWTTGATEPACPATYPDAVLTGVIDPVVPSDACSVCSCGELSATCELPDLDPNQNTLEAIKVSSRACGDPALPTVSWMAVPVGWDGTCHSPDAYLGGNTSCLPGPCNVSATSGAPVATGGSCEASGGDPASFTWSAEAKLCGGGQTGAGCPGSAACAANPAADLTPTLCIAKRGQSVCPDPFSTKLSIYEPTELLAGACSPCGCDAPAGLSCAGTVSLFSDTTGVSCTTPVAVFEAGSCADLVGNPTVAGRTFEVTAAPSGECTPRPGGGEPVTSGSIGTPTTVCCLP